MQTNEKPQHTPGPIVDPTATLYRCAECKGWNVQFEETNWYDPNTGENQDGGMLLDGRYCTDCDNGEAELEEVDASEAPEDVRQRFAEHARAEAMRAAAPDMLAMLREWLDHNEALRAHFGKRYPLDLDARERRTLDLIAKATGAA